MGRLLRRLFYLEFVPSRWRVPCFAAFGVFAGLGLVTTHVSRATSYLGNDPETCVNCHVMTTQYVTWQRSSHANVATCNDCHVPHNNLASKYAYKARDGMWHSFVFTMRLEPEAIQLSSSAIPVIEANCRRCHGQVVDAVHLREWEKGGNRCWDCHREVPHGRTRGLSTVSRIMAPELPKVEEFHGRSLIGGREPKPQNKSNE